MFMSVTNRRLATIERLLGLLVQSSIDEKERDMTTRAEFLAKLEAETSAINALTVASDVMNESHASVEEALIALKAQVAAGENPDFSDFDAAVSNLTAATGGLKAALVKGVPEFEESNN